MKLLITGAWKAQTEDLERLAALGHDIELMPDERGSLPQNIASFEGVICNGLFLYHDINLFQNLKYIQLTSAGYDRLPMEYIHSHGIKVHNAKGVYSIPMAEYAMNGVLQIYKKNSFFGENQYKKKWEKQRDLTELYGKTVCILGCGSVGKECAKRFFAFGCRVIGVDVNVRKDMYFEEILSLDDLDSCLKQSDIIVVCVPLTKETKYLLNENRISKIKTGAILVNIARGEIVETKALIEGLLEKRIGGAVLDVFEQEPLEEDNELWMMENVIVTPHNSFVGDGNRERLRQVIFENLESV